MSTPPEPRGTIHDGFTVDVDSMVRGMVFTLFAAAAYRSAAPAQQVALKQALAGLERPVEKGGTPMADIVRQIAVTMGEDWLPDDETLDLMESLSGKRLR